MGRGPALLLAVLFGLLVLALALVVQTVAAYAAFVLIFPGQRHPPMPGAPDWLYVTAFFIPVPLITLAAAIWSGRRLCRHLRRSPAMGAGGP